MRRRALTRTVVLGRTGFAAGAEHAAAQRGAAERTAAEAPEQDATDPVEQLQLLAELRDQGVLTDEEFAAEKQKILAD